MLFVEVCQCANVLKGVGVRNGDAVAVFTLIMRRLPKEIMATGEVGSDLTALEDATSVEKLKALVKAGR